MNILITQCLQKDFVAPIGRYDPLPNTLHVGHDEARRLMGENPAEGHVARVMRWAYSLPDEQLRLIHIRDWHDPSDAWQRAHLAQFGAHCIAGTEGAEFAFSTQAEGVAKQVPIIDSINLNDFVGTDLARHLESRRNEPTRVGLIGVWTEAKITFLAYELRTRFPNFEPAVCSALTASSSRNHHFHALEQLERILGVRTIAGIGAFMEWLGGESVDLPLLGYSESRPVVEHDLPELSETDATLLRYVFRDCRSLRVSELSGGFSGNLVLAAESVDMHGHRQVPHVVKIGPQEAMGQERTRFERIENVLGNTAPRISEFVDYDGRGAIKYRYASMGGEGGATFQQRYMKGAPQQEVDRILQTVFGEQLMRLYEAAETRAMDLLDYYEFSSKWASSVRSKVTALVGEEATAKDLHFPGERQVANICRFYENDIDELPRRPGDKCRTAWVHGDLNGANIVIDGRDNVWLIDFFHTHNGHVLRDLVKLENDLLYIFTRISDDELPEALELTDRLMRVRDLAAPPDPAEAAGFTAPALQRAWRTLCTLRSYYPALVDSDRDPLQLFIAQLRYAVHNLSFDESDPVQKRWALYTACRAADQVRRRLLAAGRLRVDRLETEPLLGMTLLPGRRDYFRDLDHDLAALGEDGVRRVLCLVTNDELNEYGVPDLLDRMAAAGLQVAHMPILDQKAPTDRDMGRMLGFVDEGIAAGEPVLVHCVGGLGRSGTVAACYLKRRGLGAAEALDEVRRTRGPRAVESREQEGFVRGFEA